MDVERSKGRYDFDDLNRVMGVLLGENGCPWDRAQTHKSVMTCLIEECYEVVDAVENNDSAALCEELGDVLLQVVFNARMAQQSGGFTIDDVVDGICRKMIARHSHIFGETKAETVGQVLDLWEQNKRIEKGDNAVGDRIRRVPKTFPALLRAQKILQHLSEVDNCIQNLSQSIDDALIALTELKDYTLSENDEKDDKYGYFLLKSANISRFLKINPELALTNALETYINKFKNFE